jgi:uncharacterized protein (DUF2236 family)
MAVIVVPYLDAVAAKLVRPGDAVVDFTEPRDEAALASPDSVSWRIFKNPIAVFAGGVAAVILELADPAVRSGVWQHSSFRSNPVHRLKRTGLAAMVTVYGARSLAERMIAEVVALHARVKGRTPKGEAYRANDPALLDWVHGTAAFGFVEAYSRLVCRLSDAERDRYWREGLPAALLYGATDVLGSPTAFERLLEGKRARLEASPTVFEFLKILRTAPVFPQPLRPLQGLLIGAAVELVPDWVRERLGLGEAYGLRPWQRPLVKALGRMAERTMLRSSPAVQACRRLGLGDDYIYRRKGRT